MSRRYSEKGPGLVMWLWRVAVTVVLLALLLLVNLSDPIRLLVGIALVTGLFGMAYDIVHRHWSRPTR